MHRNSIESSSKARILHVLTLNGESGIYGGPSQVAQNLCVALNKAGYEASILSGCLGSEVLDKNRLGKFRSVQVKAIFKSQPLTTLFSMKIMSELVRQIRINDVVHIHFGRELIPVTAALVSLIFKKNYILQSHGMVKPDKRKVVRIIDRFVIRFLLRKSSRILALNRTELQKLEHFSKNNIEILPNGIDLDVYQNVGVAKVNRIIFCSRIHQRKRPELFVDAAIQVMEQYPEFSFEIYGPDGGGLQQLENHINQKGYKLKDFYFGPLSHEETKQKLAESLVSVLPSYEEPFPMVILESLAAGTPVVVMPSCHISETLRKIDSSFVSQDETAVGIANALRIQLKRLIIDPNFYETPKACLRFFGQNAVSQELIRIYENTLRN
jgi:glycosyltransferase involved in cell wall biosynthesis